MQQAYLEAASNGAFATRTSQAATLLLEIRENPDGRRVLHFPYMAISDVHWGSKASRAKRVCMAMDNFSCDRLDGVGDMIGGIELMQKDNFHLGPYHRQGIARILRKAGQGTEVNYYVGNHEPGLRERIGTGKTIYGVNFLPRGQYSDPKGRYFKVEHSDLYDAQVFKTAESQARWYSIGEAFLELGQAIDQTVQKIPLKFTEKFSLSTKGKRLVKNYINKRLGVLEAIEEDIDQSKYDGMIYGHTHMKGFHATPMNKLLINDGCCTDHVQFAVHDALGNWGIIEYHRDGMNVEMENGHEYSLQWKTLGLSHFRQDPEIIEGQHTQKADRLLRIAYRMWPSLDRTMVRERIEQNEKILAICDAAITETGNHTPAALMAAFHQSQWEIHRLRDKLLHNPIPRGNTIVETTTEFRQAQPELISV